MTWFRWFRKEPPAPPPEPEDTTALSGEVRQAMQKHASSSRLVRLRAGRSEKAMRALNELLDLRATARDGIRAADQALQALDRAKHDRS